MAKRVSQAKVAGKLTDQRQRHDSPERTRVGNAKRDPRDAGECKQRNAASRCRKRNQRLRVDGSTKLLGGDEVQRKANRREDGEQVCRTFRAQMVSVYGNNEPCTTEGDQQRRPEAF